MSINGPEALLERMAEVGVAPLDNQTVANNLGRGVDCCSMSGNLPGQESLVSEDLVAALPNAEPVSKIQEPDPSQTFSARLPGLT